MAEDPLHNSTEESKSAARSQIEVGSIEVGGDVRGNVTVGHGNIITQIINFFRIDSKGQIERRKRRLMLRSVENSWIRDVLEESLYGPALLELGVRRDPNAVRSYPRTVTKKPTDEALPAGKSMLEIFREIGSERSLLILGEPGSGKTTLLLELARQLIEGARDDEAEPMPVVFKLASWKESQSLVDWLIEQFNIRYHVQKKTALTWLDENRVLLLLDGLDEVKESSRGKCVEAINGFRNQHDFLSLVVSSRSAEYKAFNALLAFDGAITLQPLTTRQINAYVASFGEPLAHVRGLLKKDKSLRELAQSPLMLSIMVLAYKDLEDGEASALRGLADRRRHLFNTYIERRFERSDHSVNTSFTKSETLHYLSWLARTMIQHNIDPYQIELMQPAWLANTRQGRSYRWYVGLLTGLTVVLTPGLISGLISVLAFAPSLGPLDLHVLGLGLMIQLLSGLIVASIVGLIVGWNAATDRIRMISRLTWGWEAARRGLLIGLSFGAMSALSGLILSYSSGVWASVILILGMLFGLGGAPEVRRMIAAKWKHAWQEDRSAVLSGLILGLFGGFWFGMLLGGLFGGLLNGLTSGQVEPITYPGQHLKQTLWNGLFLALVCAVLGGLSLGLLLALFLMSILGLFFGIDWTFIGLLLGGLVAGLLGGMLGGWFSLIQHYSLRRVLHRYHLLPRQLIPFLDHCVDLIFLRRVGGSYIFVHRLLMEHFAEMEA